MVCCRNINKKKNYENHYFFNRLLVLVYTITLMFESYSSALETESNNIICSNALTCTKCTIKAQCQWSLEQQKCIKKIHFSSLTASTIGECPQFSVDKQYDYNDNCVSLKYIFKVSNDSVGFMNYLRTTNIYLRRKLYKDKFLVKDRTNNSFIFLLNTTETFYKSFGIQSITEFIFIEFNYVMLRFDNVADHYVTFHKRYDKKCADDEKEKFCATCAWNYNGYSNYLKWCSNDNVCVGRKLLYLSNNNAKDKVPLKSILNQHNGEAYVTNDCAEVNVTAVDPLFGPHTGGTAVTITVRSHRILAENQTIMVMVAGSVCTDPRTSGPETITCITSPWVNVTGGPPTLGPIVVKYSSDKGKLTIVSSQIFRYDVRPTCGTPSPVLDANQRLNALESGDTTVPVRGVHFVEPCVATSARLFVVLPNGSMEFASSYCDIPANDTYMVCRSPRVDSRVWRSGNSSVEGVLLNFGLNLMNFIGNRSLSVKGPSHGFHVLFEPVLADFNITQPPLFSGWFRVIIWLCTGLLLTGSFVCYLKTKNQYRLSKTVGDPPVASTRSQAGVHYHVVLSS